MEDLKNTRNFSLISMLHELKRSIAKLELTLKVKEEKRVTKTGPKNHPTVFWTSSEWNALSSDSEKNKIISAIEEAKNIEKKLELLAISNIQQNFRGVSPEDIKYPNKDTIEILKEKLCPHAHETLKGNNVNIGILHEQLLATS